MSDEQPRADQAAAYTPPATQADLDRIIADRVSRVQAKYADYADLRAKASKFDELAEAQKTELQKAVERAEAAEKRAQEFETAKQIDGWKAEAAKAAGVPASALRGSTQEEIAAHAEELKALIPAQDATPKGAVGPYVPAEGGTPAGAVTGGPGQEFAAFLQGQLNR
jgi:hypothetical protein